MLDGKHAPDDFRHEQYLLIEEAGRRILISGCSHRGILNIATHFRPDILIGGFHLRHTPAAQLHDIAEILRQLPTYFYTGHCTGATELDILQQHLAHRLQAFSTGQNITI
jgi:7,8-dihydropterin-6-yl-methyl-4-(beta-D-ribofuranosyl)aminobenzene 5'-phosphate synthase